MENPHEAGRGSPARAPAVRTAEFPSLCHVQYTPGQWNTAHEPEPRREEGPVTDPTVK
jgi:hypothetical protein